jgi:hypothetical protein
VGGRGFCPDGGVVLSEGRSIVPLRIGAEVRSWRWFGSPGEKEREKLGKRNIGGFGARTRNKSSARNIKTSKFKSKQFF